MESFKLLYKSLVRAHLEYCNVIADPAFEKQANLLEEVLRRVTKLVLEIKYMACMDKLERVDLPSLYYRRHCGDTIDAYKYTHEI